MSKVPSLLDSVRIASPCLAAWEDMTGDDRVRHCDLCRLNVYDLSGMGRAEAEELIRGTEGRLCGRLHRRADGTVLTRDCPEGRLRALRRRAAAVLAVAVFGLLTVAGWASGRTGPRRDWRSATHHLRQYEPLGTILEWLDPSPRYVMGMIGLTTRVTGGDCPPNDVSADEY